MTILLLYVACAVALSCVLARAGFRASDALVAPAAATVPAGARVLVVGATGGTGRQLVAQALARGFHVRALVRRPRALPISHPRLEVVQGDVLDPASVARALDGIDAVLSALGHHRFLGPSRIQSEGTRNLVRAMEAAGTRRFVCETSIGLGDTAFRMGLVYTLFLIPVVLPFYFYDKCRQERAIAASALDWVIVRPGVLTDGPGSGGSRQVLPRNAWLFSPRVARADVADVMLRMLSEPHHVHTAIIVAG